MRLGHGRITLLACFRATGDGPYLIGAGGVGYLSLSVDGTVLAEGTTPDPADPVEAMVRPGEIRATVPLRAGQETEIEVTLLPSGGAPGPVSIRLGAVPAPDEDAMLEAAVQAAREAGAAVVIVGSAPARPGGRPGLRGAAPGGWGGSRGRRRTAAGTGARRVRRGGRPPG